MLSSITFDCEQNVRNQRITTWINRAQASTGFGKSKLMPSKAVDTTDLSKFKSNIYPPTYPQSDLYVISEEYTFYPVSTAPTISPTNLN